MLSYSQNLQFLQPIGRVLVESRPESINIGPLVMTQDHSQQKCILGKVVSVGIAAHGKDEVSIDALDLSIGDYIVYQSWAGVEFHKDNDTSYQLLKPSEVIAIIKQENISQYKNFKGANA